MSVQLKSIAVLIDADNASAKNIGQILKEIEKIGHITCKKIYGDWGNAHIQSWQEALLKHAIDPMQQFAYVKGKNATDIGMVIEAMDLLHSGLYDGFCLISSDSDFTSLALRIRKNHVKVFGFGKRNTVSAFSQACDTFFYVEDLLVSIKTSSNPQISNSKITQDNKKIIHKKEHKVISAWNENRLKCDTKLLNSLRASIVDHPRTEDNRWVNFALIGNEIKKHHPTFDSQYYGYSKLADIIKKISLFETKTVNSTLYVREKKTKKSKGKTNVSPNKATTRFTTKQLQAQTHLIGVLNKLIRENPNTTQGWSNSSYIASQLKKHYKNIKLDRYGYKSFSDLIKAIDLYDIEHRNSTVLVKLKNIQQKPSDHMNYSPSLNCSSHVQKTWNDTQDEGLCMLSEIYGVTLYDGYGD
ncbi:NYN domain-containing protein [Psychrobacter sp. AOP7-B1-24]|uniref:NYN domain-containing protein n=1 Tax=Psychrobacter sp. AOP7-B1-24 TaxID=3457645 RepID=UPI00402BE926